MQLRPPLHHKLSQADGAGRGPRAEDASFMVEARCYFITVTSVTWLRLLPSVSTSPSWSFSLFSFPTPSLHTFFYYYYSLGPCQFCFLSLHHSVNRPQLPPIHNPLLPPSSHSVCHIHSVHQIFLKRFRSFLLSSGAAIKRLSPR